MNTRSNSNFTADLQLGEGFTVKSMHRCRLVFGLVPAREVSMLTHGYSKRAIMDSDIASRIGACMVVGEPEDIAALRTLDLPVSAKRHQEWQEAVDSGLPDVATWLRTGERGLSSEAMCKRIFGLPRDGGVKHPVDPDDLRRCILFLDAVGTHDRVSLMRDVSLEWASLVAIWDELTATLREEGSTRRCPQTYRLMHDALQMAAQCGCEF